MNRRIGKLPEAVWFNWFQPLLLEMAETYYGRDLLCIPTDLPQLDLITPNMVRSRVAESLWITEFRNHSKYAKVIRHRWKEFQEYQRHLEDREYAKVVRQAALLGVPVIAGGTDSCFFPDPNPEVNTVDGRVVRQLGAGPTEAWATIIAGAGTSARDDEHDEIILQVQASATTDEYRGVHRGIFLFDTSSIPDEDVISNVVFSLNIEFVRNGLLGEDSDNSKMVLVSSDPASNTALVAADYGELGSVDFGRSVKQADLVDENYADTTLNASGIANVDKTGISKFGVMYGWDFDALDPHDNGITWASGALNTIDVHTSEHSGTGKDPKLCVTHAPIPPTPTADAPKFGQPIDQTLANRPGFGQSEERVA